MFSSKDDRRKLRIAALQGCSESRADSHKIQLRYYNKYANNYFMDTGSGVFISLFIIHKEKQNK